MGMRLVPQRAQNPHLDLLASQVIGKITFDEVNPSVFKTLLATLRKIKNLFARMIGKPVVDRTGLTLDEKQARQLMKNVSYILRNKPIEISSIQVPLHVQELCSLFLQRVSQRNPSITKSEISQVILKAFEALADDKNDHEISLSTKQVQQLEISLKLWMSPSDPLKTQRLTYKNTAIAVLGLASVFFSISKLFFSLDATSLNRTNLLLNFSNQSFVCVEDKVASSLSSRLVDLISWKAAPFLALREVSLSQLTTQDVQIRSDISLIKMPKPLKSPRYPAPLLPTGVTFKPDFSVSTPVYQDLNRALFLAGNAPTPSINSRLLNLISWKAAPFLVLRDGGGPPLTTHRGRGEFALSLIKIPMLCESVSYLTPLLPTGITLKTDFAVTASAYQDLSRNLVLLGNAPTPLINTNLLDLISWKVAAFFGVKKADLSLLIVVNRDIGNGLSLPEISLLTQSPSYTEGDLELTSQKSRFMHARLDWQTYFNSST